MKLLNEILENVLDGVEKKVITLPALGCMVMKLNRKSAIQSR